MTQDSLREQDGDASRRRTTARLRLAAGARRKELAALSLYSLGGTKIDQGTLPVGRGGEARPKDAAELLLRAKRAGPAR